MNTVSAALAAGRDVFSVPGSIFSPLCEGTNQLLREGAVPAVTGADILLWYGLAQPEQQTYRILCPCHQSQFDALHFARPIFGPAARALAQLPITIDKDGYLVANGDFIEPVGPAFWERTS